CDEYSATANIEITGGTSTVNVACDGSNFTADLAFADETNATPTIEVTITDPAGNFATDSRDFILDTVNPTLAIISPTSGSYINNVNSSSFDLSGECSEALSSSVVVKEGSTTYATVNCTAGTPKTWSATV